MGNLSATSYLFHLLNIKKELFKEYKFIFDMTWFISLKIFCIYALYQKFY